MERSALDFYCWRLRDWLWWPHVLQATFAVLLPSCQWERDTKRCFKAVKWQGWDFNQGLAALPKLGFHTA